MSGKITRIVVDFAAPVDVADDMQRAIVKFADIICRDYEKANPGRAMWPCGIGSMPTYIPMTREEEEAGRHIEFDDSVCHIDCAERERYPDERPRPRAEPIHILRWRSIKTAPKDDTLIIAACADGRRMIWRGAILAGAMRESTPEHLRFPAVAWMPLPEFEIKGDA